MELTVKELEIMKGKGFWSFIKLYKALGNRLSKKRASHLVCYS